MYVERHAQAMRAQIFLTGYVIIYYRFYVKVLVRVYEHTKTTRTIISTLAGALLCK
jgi:hypothetical protein